MSQDFCADRSEEVVVDEVGDDDVVVSNVRESIG
jgi:hypothetical protein